ncbi:hypothetical protein MMC29_004471, partial [Sticta canariensis]|nr:hypothetical protein [Sticta canariensis]
MERELSGLLQDETDTKKIFKSFAKLYNHHNAETVFNFAAKIIKFDEPLRNDRLRKSLFWIK